MRLSMRMRDREPERDLSIDEAAVLAGGRRAAFCVEIARRTLPAGLATTFDDLRANPELTRRLEDVERHLADKGLIRPSATKPELVIRTRAGQRLLNAHRHQQDALRLAASHGRELEPGEAALAIGLFGLSAVDDADLRAHLRTQITGPTTHWSRRFAPDPDWAVGAGAFGAYGLGGGGFFAAAGAAADAAAALAAGVAEAAVVAEVAANGAADGVSAGRPIDGRPLPRHRPRLETGTGPVHRALAGG